MKESDQKFIVVLAVILFGVTFFLYISAIHGIASDIHREVSGIRDSLELIRADTAGGPRMRTDTWLKLLEIEGMLEGERELVEEIERETACVAGQDGQWYGYTFARIQGLTFILVNIEADLTEEQCRAIYG